MIIIDHQDDPNCDEPLGSMMAEAAEKSKAIEEEEVDDTDEVHYNIKAKRLK